MNYTIYHNLSRDGRLDGYEPGQPLVRGYSGQMIEVLPGSSESPLEAIYERHNRGDRPDGKQAPSLSSGDVVMLTNTLRRPAAFTCSRDGWDHVIGFSEESHNVVPGTYLEAIKRPEFAT